ncbi:MAG: DUF1761 domain-containing protein [Myxococcaceae bacterium]
MFHALSEVRWSGVVFAFVPYFVLGGLWFTVFFPNAYRRSLGRETEPQEKPRPIFVIGPAICSLVVTITTAVLLKALRIESYADGLQFGVWVGLGYLVANTVNIAINPNIPRPLFYGLISGGFHMVGILMVTAVLVAMR